MAFSSTATDGFRELKQRVEYALSRCQEEQWLEFKRAAPWDALKWHLLKTLMAMANLRDGGLVVVGVAEQGSQWHPEGVTSEHLATYSYDEIKEALAKHASPAVHIDVVTHTDLESRTFLVFHVKQTHFSPVICKRDSSQDVDGKSTLCQGHIYIRPATGRPSTRRVMDAESIHELLDVAAEQRARRLIENATRVGLVAPSTQKAAYDEEVAGLVPLVPRVHAGPFWSVTYRPGRYQPHRIASLGDCRKLIERARVQWRGWDFPCVIRGSIRSDANWIGAAADVPGIAEYWRLFLSGQFTHVASVREVIEHGWRAKLQRANEWHHGREDGKDWSSTPGFISLTNLVYNVTEYFEFAGRLVGAGSYTDAVDITVRLTGVQGFVLTPEMEWRWGVDAVASRNELENTWSIPADRLMADSTAYSLKAIVWLCQCFSWGEPHIESLKSEQQRLVRS